MYLLFLSCHPPPLDVSTAEVKTSSGSSAPVVGTEYIFVASTSTRGRVPQLRRWGQQDKADLPCLWGQLQLLELWMISRQKRERVSGEGVPWKGGDGVMTFWGSRNGLRGNPEHRLTTLDVLSQVLPNPNKEETPFSVPTTEVHHTR